MALLANPWAACFVRPERESILYHTFRSWIQGGIFMSRKRANKTRPFVQLDAQLIRLYLPIIGAHGLAVYTTLKLHENRRTGQCNPSYQTVADETGLSRPTVIKYTQLLAALKLIVIVPIWLSIERRSSNQYVFASLGDLDRKEPVPIPPPDGYVEENGGGQGDFPPPEKAVKIVDYPSQQDIPKPNPLNQNDITNNTTPQKSNTAKQKTQHASGRGGTALRYRY